MNRLTTDTPNGNFETMMNFAYAKNGEVWLRGADYGKDAELCAYIAKSAFYLELCGITNKDDVIEACGAADCFCELGALFAAATQAAELRARLAAYEDTGLAPDELEKLVAFKEYFDALYGQGLQIANWHMNGDLEPFDSFYEEAISDNEEEDPDGKNDQMEP